MTKCDERRLRAVELRATTSGEFDPSSVAAWGSTKMCGAGLPRAVDDERLSGPVAEAWTFRNVRPIRDILAKAPWEIGSPSFCAAHLEPKRWLEKPWRRVFDGNDCIREELDDEPWRPPARESNLYRSLKNPDAPRVLFGRRHGLCLR